MTDNRASARTERTKLFEQMAKLEAADASLSKTFEPVWEKVARAQEQADGGHSVDRHGADKTDAQLTTRLTTGVAADGKFSPTRGSTRFSSHKDWVLTRDATYKAIEANNPGLDLSKPPLGSITNYRIRVEYNRAIDEGFVGDLASQITVADPTNPSKTGRGYTSYDTIDGVTRTQSVIEWDGNRWALKQHFPVGIDWDNTNKTYLPTTAPSTPPLVRATIE